MSRLEIATRMQTPATLSPQSVGFVPYPGNPQTEHQKMFTVVEEVYPTANQFPTQQHSGRGISRQGHSKIVPSFLQQPQKTSNPPPPHQPRPFNIMIAPQDDVWGPPTGIDTFDRTSLSDHIVNTHKSLEQFVRAYSPQGAFPVNSQLSAVKHLVYLARDHLDGRQMATTMLENPVFRISLLAGNHQPCLGEQSLQRGSAFGNL